MRFASLASGSKGNATFVCSGDTRIIVDNGLSLKELTKRLAEIGERTEDISAFVITHAHGDHSNGLAPAIKDGMRRGRAVPVWATEGTAEWIDWQGIERPPVERFAAGKSFVIGDIEVSTFTVSHDCADPVGFVLSDNRSRCGIATDLGFIPPGMIWRFRACDLILIESNYDPEMLRLCDRLNSAKQRICGRNGHLSNQQCCEYLREGLSPVVRSVVLGHISQVTNSESIVRAQAREALLGCGLGDKFVLASQNNISDVFTL